MIGEEKKMLNQRRFEEPPMAIGEKKQVVVLKLDCSGSMSYDEKIKKLNEAVNKMLEKCRADDLVSKNVEFIIIIYRNKFYSLFRNKLSSF